MVGIDDREAMERIERRIIELLAEDEGCTPEGLRRRLLESGEEMPVDSFLTVELIAALEEEIGIEVPANQTTAESLRSVRDFARRIADLAKAQAGGRR